MAHNNIYLDDIPLSEAKERLSKALYEAGLWEPLGEEAIPLYEASGRVTSRPIWARMSSPHYHAAAMDGYAIRAIDAQTASDRNPVILHIGSQAQYVDTGDPMPDWANAVVMIEQVEPVGESKEGRAIKAILLRNSLAPWKNVRPMGEDIVATELVLPAGHVLRPVDLGAIAGCGYATVWLHRKPRVAIIPTGTELVPAGTSPKAGEIIEYNSLVLAAQIETWGGQAIRLSSVPDDFEQIKAAINKASKDSDLILVNAGSSAGSEDFTARVIESLGSLLVHGIAIRPGHPVIIGMIDRPAARSKTVRSRIPIFGIPGYPVSAALTGEIFIEPLLARWLGRPRLKALTIEATLTRKVHSSMGDDEYLRVSVGKVDNRVIATPLARGAGAITSLVRADGIVLIPAGVQGFQAGDKVQVNLYCSRADIDRTIVILGSHDLTIDLMAQFLALRNIRLISANLGSLGGLIALGRGEAHLTGSHLLDPETGEYNLSYIRRYLPNKPVVVIGLVTREQGLIIPPNNPKAIKSLADLSRTDITYVNRQRGAGTRVLLDYHLNQLDISSISIYGYKREEYTHLAVAAAIASGRADCGLGIHAAAKALNLDFIPLYKEKYQLVISREYYTSPLLQPLLALFKDEKFRMAVTQLPGYDIQPMGRLIAEIE
jgi:putative molybdopterin biosynthesis protein